MSRPEPGTPLADAWCRVIDHANVAGAGVMSKTIASDRERGRGMEQARGIVQTYGLDPEDVHELLMFAFGAFVGALQHGADAVDAFCSTGATLLLTGCEVTADPRSEANGG